MDRILGLVIAVGFGAALAIIYLSRNPQYIIQKDTEERHTKPSPHVVQKGA